MITVYTRSDCSFCVKAKTLLRVHNIPFTEVKVGADITRDAVKELFPTATTLPIITVEDVYIGGFTQLDQYLKESHTDDSDNMLLG